jgi:hypothetical protein
MADTTKSKTLITRVMNKYDTKANWETNNPVLLKGEFAVIEVPSSTTGGQASYQLKVGDGTSKFNDLKYLSSGYTGANGISVGEDFSISHTNAITAGTVGPTADAKPAFNTSFTVPYLEYDAQGHITSATNHSITLPNHSHSTLTITDGTNSDTYNATAAKTLKFANGTNTTASVSAASNVITVKYDSVDTKNTVGATANDSTKLWIIGATEQTDNPQSYTNSNVYINYSSSKAILTAPYFSGNGSSLTNLNASNLASGIIPDARLKTITRTNNTSTASPAHEGTFTVIDSITSDSYGRVTAVNTKTVTLPSDKDTHYIGLNVLANNDGTASTASSTDLANEEVNFLHYEVDGSNKYITSHHKFVGSGIATVTGKVVAESGDDNHDITGTITINVAAESSTGTSTSATMTQKAITDTITTLKSDLEKEISEVISASDAMVFKGTLGTGGTITSLPSTYKVGDTYRIVATGTYAGENCEVGDLIIAVNSRTTASTTVTNADWTVAQTNIDGAITNITLATNSGLSVSTSGTTRTIGHSNVLSDAGTASSSTSGTAAFGGTIYIPKIKYDINGHITSVDTTSFKLPPNPNTDTKVTQNLSTANSNLPLLASYYAKDSTTTTAQTVNRNDNVYMNPSTGTITATNLTATGTLTGSLNQSNITQETGEYIIFECGSSSVNI